MPFTISTKKEDVRKKEKEEMQKSRLFKIIPDPAIEDPYSAELWAYRIAFLYIHGSIPSGRHHRAEFCPRGLGRGRRPALPRCPIVLHRRPSSLPVHLCLVFLQDTNFISLFTTNSVTPSKTIKFYLYVSLIYLYDTSRILYRLNLVSFAFSNKRLKSKK